LDGRFHMLSLRGPYNVGPERYSWFELQFTVGGARARPATAEASRQKLIQFIETAAIHYRADARRVFVLGFGQGATLALLVALTQPGTLAGAMLLGARFPEELLVSTSPVARHFAGRMALKGFPFFMAHGTEDDTVPIAQAVEARERLLDMGAEVVFREYPMGHQVTRQCLSDLGVWLSARLITRV
jgi:phospholipase/carboxylesterase